MGAAGHRAGRLTRASAPLLVILMLVSVSASARPDGRTTVGHPVEGVVALVLAAAPADDPYHGQLCGGVLVAPGTVLPSAHCVAERMPGSLDAIIGADNLCRGAPIDGSRLSVAGIAIHPAYDPATGRSDLAALTLA